MSEIAPAPAAAQPGPAVSGRIRRNWLNPLEALERGFALFQATFAREAWRYYAGSAPIALCFIPMWVIDGQIRISTGVLLIEAAILAGAYLLRAWTVAGYMQHVRERAFGVPVSKSGGVAAQSASVGRLLAWKITLGAAALATLPSVAGASWFYSASQFASFEAQEDATERHSLSGCITLAGQCFGVGLLLFLMVFPLWIAIGLNGFLLAIILPALLHSILGLNTFLSTGMGFYSLISSSAFWLSLIGGSWLAVDPVVKCTFVVIYQNLRSRREGDDLRGILASLPREQKKKAELIASTGGGSGVRIGTMIGMIVALLLVGFQMVAPRAAQAQQRQINSQSAVDSARATRIQKLRKALDEESQRAMYRWHDSEHPSPPTWFGKLLKRIGKVIKRGWDAISRFIHKLWPSGLSLSPGPNKGTWRLKDIRLWLGLIAVFTLTVGALFFIRRRRREATELSVPVATAFIPDLDDSAVASERTEDEWLDLANQLAGEGALRLALRASYLGLLAGLARREWLTIRRDRTNREYLTEFTRRWRRRPQAAIEARTEIPEKLRGSLRQFDRVWYGSYTLTAAAVAAYCQDQRDLLDHV